MDGFDDAASQHTQPKSSAAPVIPGAGCADPAVRAPVTLVKGGHKWTFSCDAGDEPELLRRVTELARGEDVPFDWFDAALVTHQLSKRLKAGLYRIDGNSTGTMP
jgi:hypothetical protein